MLTWLTLGMNRRVQWPPKWPCLVLTTCCSTSGKDVPFGTILPGGSNEFLRLTGLVVTTSWAQTDGNSPQSVYVTHAYLPWTISWSWEQSLLIPSGKTKPTSMAGGVFPCGPQNGDHGWRQMPCSKQLLMQSHPKCSLRSEHAGDGFWRVLGPWWTNAPQCAKLGLGCHIQRAFKADRLQRTIDAGTAIESFLAQGKVQEAWTWLKALYHHARN